MTEVISDEIKPKFESCLTESALYVNSWVMSHWIKFTFESCLMWIQSTLESRLTESALYVSFFFEVMSDHINSTLESFLTEFSQCLSQVSCEFSQCLSHVCLNSVPWLIWVNQTTDIKTRSVETWLIWVMAHVNESHLTEFSPMTHLSHDSCQWVTSYWIQSHDSFESWLMWMSHILLNSVPWLLWVMTHVNESHLTESSPMTHLSHDSCKWVISYRIQSHDSFESSPI